VTLNQHGLFELKLFFYIQIIRSHVILILRAWFIELCVLFQMRDNLNEIYG